MLLLLLMMLLVGSCGWLFIYMYVCIVFCVCRLIDYFNSILKSNIYVINLNKWLSFRSILYIIFNYLII